MLVLIQSTAPMVIYPDTKLQTYTLQAKASNFKIRGFLLKDVSEKKE